MSKVSVTFILDRSGSMSGLESDVIGGFNSYIETLRKEKSQNDFTISVTLFDNIVEQLWKNVPLNAVRKLTPDDYFVRGSTALLDAVGDTVSAIDDGGHCSVCHQPKKSNTKQLVIVHTDGYENASSRWNKDKIKNLIGEREKAGNWTFTFFGADQDAWVNSSQYGFVRTNSAKYSRHQTQDLYRSTAVSTGGLGMSSGMSSQLFASTTMAAMDNFNLTSSDAAAMLDATDVKKPKPKPAKPAPKPTKKKGQLIEDIGTTVQSP